MKCNFYQCSNIDCRFRFPSKSMNVYSLQCPICQSKVLISTIVELEEEDNFTQHNFSDPHIEALLDNVRSAWNVGSMIRTSDGFGVRHLYLCGITPTPENKRVAKTSLGAEKVINWTHINNSIDKLRELKEKNYFLVILEGYSNANNIYQVEEFRLTYPLVLVVGNEVCGVDPEIIDMSDLILSIPMIGFKKSLNVAVAFGIAMSIFKLTC